MKCIPLNTVPTPVPTGTPFPNGNCCCRGAVTGGFCGVCGAYGENHDSSAPAVSLLVVSLLARLSSRSIVCTGAGVDATGCTDTGGFCCALTGAWTRAAIRGFAAGIRSCVRRSSRIELLDRSGLGVRCRSLLPCCRSSALLLRARLPAPPLPPGLRSSSPLSFGPYTSGLRPCINNSFGESWPLGAKSLFSYLSLMKLYMISFLSPSRGRSRSLGNRYWK